MFQLWVINSWFVFFDGWKRANGRSVVVELRTKIDGEDCHLNEWRIQIYLKGHMWSFLKARV